jgi:uncharacterized C2H2 Zn-finger protein
MSKKYPLGLKCDCGKICDSLESLKHHRRYACEKNPNRLPHKTTRSKTKSPNFECPKCKAIGKDYKAYTMNKIREHIFKEHKEGKQTTLEDINDKS